MLQSEEWKCNIRVAVLHASSTHIHQVAYLDQTSKQQKKGADTLAQNSQFQCLRSGVLQNVQIDTTTDQLFAVIGCRPVDRKERVRMRAARETEDRGNSPAELVYDVRIAANAALCRKVRAEQA